MPLDYQVAPTLSRTVAIRPAPQEVPLLDDGCVTGWRVPAREELLPVDPLQSCVFCGSDDWAWLYLLLRAPDWVQQLGWFGNWFEVMCDDCHDMAERGDTVRLQAQWQRHPDVASGLERVEFDERYRVLAAMQSEPPIPRRLVTAE